MFAPQVTPSPSQPPTPVDSAANPAAAGESPPPEAATTAPPDTAKPAAPARRRSAGIRPRTGSKPLVVIDAGHGGKDVGAISVTGGYEKDVTLAIAR